MPFSAQLLIADHELAALRAHLLPPDNVLEQAAFGFARVESVEDQLLLRLMEWLPVKRDGFDVQSEAYLKLRDGMSGHVIKRAHDLGCSLIEFHSHMGHWPAMFSPSDLHGFEEFVPHVWWRLKGRPYAAIVVTDAGFDGLAWADSPNTPIALDALTTPHKTQKASRLTIQEIAKGPYVTL